MNLRCLPVSLALAFVLVVSGVAAPAEEVIEAWRSPFGRARSVSVNSSDGSCWAATGSSVMHLAADGTVLGQTNGFWSPECVSANASDGSCWVADTGNDQVVHLDEDGTELWRGGDFSAPGSVSVNVADGSCWVADTQNDQAVQLAENGAELWRVGNFSGPHFVSVNTADGSCWVADTDNNQVVHLGADGAELWRGGGFIRPESVSVNPTDDSCWVADTGNDQVVHLAEDGTELWRGGAFLRPTSVSVDSTDGSCCVADRGSWYDPFYWYGQWVGPSVVRLREDGTELWRGGGMDVASHVCVNPADSSCWVAGGYTVAHLAEDAEELWRGGYYREPESVSVNPTEGSCWVGDGDWVVRVAEDGSSLGQWSVYYPVMLLDAPTDSPWRLDDSRNGGQAQLDGDDGPLWWERHFLRPQRVSVNSADGSCWVAGTSDFMYAARVVHLAEDGTVLGIGPSWSWPRSVSVNREDGSCWVYQTRYGILEQGVGEISHLAEDGTTLSTGGTLHEYGSVAVNPANGSCAVVEGGSVSVNPTDGSHWVVHLGGSQVRRFSQDGTELWCGGGFSGPMAISVNSADGSCWVADTYSNEVVHLGADGEELWRGGQFDRPWSISVNVADGSCWVADRGNRQVVHLVVPGWRPPVFYDVPPYSWAFEEVDACFREGIVSGYPDGLYHPTLPVSRAQMAVFISRALAGGDGAVPEGPRHPSFGDVPPSHWAYKYVEYAKSCGIVFGYGKLYRPSPVVRRDEMAVFIARAIADPTGEEGLADYSPPEIPTFSDLPADFWAYKYIEYIAAAGVTHGYPDGLYHPEYVVSRGLMALYVARAFELPY